VQYYAKHLYCAECINIARTIVAYILMHLVVSFLHFLVFVILNADSRPSLLAYYITLCHGFLTWPE